MTFCPENRPLWHGPGLIASRKWPFPRKTRRAGSEERTFLFMFSAASESRRKHSPFPESPRRNTRSPPPHLDADNVLRTPLPPASLAAIPYNASSRIASLLNNKTWERGPGGEGQAPKHSPFPEPPRRQRRSTFYGLIPLATFPNRKRKVKYSAGGLPLLIKKGVFA